MVLLLNFNELLAGRGNGLICKDPSADEGK